MNEPNGLKTRALGLVGACVRVFAWTFGLVVIIATALIVFKALTLTTPDAHGGAEQVGKPIRKCPPDVSIPPRAKGMPVDDVLGVRPGFTIAEASETLLCRSEDYEMERRSVGDAGALGGVHPLLTAKLGQETVEISAFGPDTRVASMWREDFFDAGKGPKIAEIEHAMEVAYGEAHEAKSVGHGARELNWTYAPDGSPLRVKPINGSSSYLQDTMAYFAGGYTTAACLGKANADPRAAPAFDKKCGLTIRVQIDPDFDDATLASHWRLTLVDQQVLSRQIMPPAAPKP